MADQSNFMESQQIINVEKFARSNELRKGQVDTSILPRLKGLINTSTQLLDYSIEGSLTTRREPQIKCTIRGSVYLQCQRCLGDILQPIEVDSTVVFVQDEEKLPLIEDEDQAIDYVVLPDSLNLAELIEEEILLALPLVPRHEEGKCIELSAQQDSGKKESPFAVLAKLKQS